MPEETDIAYDFLSVIATVDILRDPMFKVTLQRLYNRDPMVIDWIISPMITHESFNSQESE